jgi:heterodisulfide reductase subunit B
MWLDVLFQRLGAAVVDYPPKVRCCGGMLMTTKPDVGLRLNYDLLAEAIDSGANVIVTTCPLCQINLEAYQERVSKAFGRRIRIPVLFFTQLLGLALGAGERELGMHLNLVPLRLKLPPLAEAAHV